VSLMHAGVTYADAGHGQAPHTSGSWFSRKDELKDVTAPNLHAGTVL